MESNPLNSAPWRLSVAPMMDWTDRHCRFFHRLMSRRALLYTEMVTAPAVIRAEDWARARLLLLLGQFQEGWQACRWGFEAGARRWRPPPLPEYDGETATAWVALWGDGRRPSRSSWPA